MAVHTIVEFADAEAFVSRYALGNLNALSGIEQGIENTNYRLDTDTGPVLLTLFERRTSVADLPWLIALHDHLAERGVAVPPVLRPIEGEVLGALAGRPAALFGWIDGEAITEPSLDHCEATGAALGRMHAALADFAPVRKNPQGRESWHALADSYRDRLDDLEPGLAVELDAALARIEFDWPLGLSHATIHADLFPDNVMVDGNATTGLIDFAFACRDIRAYDLAVMHAAWCFDPTGTHFHADRASALLHGYARSHGLSPEERAALPLLCLGASLRFLLTRAEDWFAPEGATTVLRKDPLAFARRLRFYAAADSEDMTRI